MGKSRYVDTPTVDGALAPYSLPSRALGMRGLDLLRGVRTFEHVVSAGERLDHLAALYFDDDSYWWVIALANEISYGLGLEPGRRLLVPYDVRDVLDRITR